MKPQLVAIIISLTIITACSTAKPKKSNKNNIDIKTASELTIYPVTRASFFIFPAGYSDFPSFMIRQMLTLKLNQLRYRERHRDPMMKVYLGIRNNPNRLIVSLKDKFGNTLWRGEAVDHSGCKQINKIAPELLTVLFKDFPKSTSSRTTTSLNFKEQRGIRDLRSIFSRTIKNWNCNN